MVGVRNAVGQVLGPLRAVMGCSDGLGGRSWAAPGASVGCSWSTCGRSWGSPGASVCGPGGLLVPKVGNPVKGSSIPSGGRGEPFFLHW